MDRDGRRRRSGARGGPGRRPPRRRRRRVSGRRRPPDPGPPRGAAAHPGGQREPGGATAAGAGRRHAAGAPAARRGHRRGRAVRGGAAGHRPRRLDAARAPARAGPRAPDVARGPAAVHPGAVGRPARRCPRHAARPDAAHARRHRRGGARPPPPVRRRRGRRRGRRPRRGARPHRAGRRAGAVLQRLGLDAAARPDREEHPRLARPAVAALRHRHPDAGRDPRRGARPPRAVGHHRAVADRPVGAFPGEPADQGLARQPGRGRVGVLARRLRDRRRPRRRGGLGRPPAARLAAGRAAGLGHGPQPHGHRLALGHRAPGVVPVAARAALPGLHVRRREPRRARPGRDPDRGPLLGQQRRRGRVRAARPADRRAAVHLPRQRRHELSRGTTRPSWTSARRPSGSR